MELIDQLNKYRQLKQAQNIEGLAQLILENESEMTAGEGRPMELRIKPIRIFEALKGLSKAFQSDDIEESTTRWIYSILDAVPVEAEETTPEEST
jgi:hypothetical protein